MSPERFELLAEGFLDDALTDAEARELAEAVEASPELRAKLLDAVTMAGLLSRARGTSKDLAPSVLAALRAPADKDALVKNVLSHLPRRRRVWPWAVAAAAAVLLAALVLRTAPPAPVVPAPVAAAATTFKDWANRDAAVAKAVDYLRTAKAPPSTHQGPMPADDLVLLALLTAGVPESDPFVAELLKKTTAAPLQRVYTVALHAMALQTLGGRAERLEACARFLIDNQTEDGRWPYGNATVPLPGTKQVRTGQSGPNNSCTIFAALGLRACADGGVKIPLETLERGAQGWRNCQLPDADATGADDRGGWCYLREEKDHHPYGSMTAGGLGALATLDLLAGRDPRKDAAAVKGLNWLVYHFTVLENFGPVEDLMAKEIVSDTPAPMTEFYYYMWMLERVGGTLGLVKMGDRDWFHEGAHELLMLQRADGSWSSGVKRCQPAWDTCYAILFLMRPTRPLEVR
ncbi:MAG TPA: prenyltransferase/squalene oxidase repeat-containing protein [Planctomycetota bacterium]